MIEVREFGSGVDTSSCQLFINGAAVDRVSVYYDSISSSGVKVYQIWCNDESTSEMLASHALSEFPPFRYISMRYKFDWLNQPGTILVDIGKQGHPEIIFACGAILSIWKEGYSFAEYFSELAKVVKATNDIAVDFHSDDITVNFHSDEGAEYTSFAIHFKDISPQLAIASEIARCSKILGAAHEEVIKLLAARARSNSVITYFDFPAEVRVACEQYLLYFVQFLKDLGVEVTAELHHKAGQVLFAVTPANKEEALDKIRAALENYLTLAGSPVDSISMLNSEIAIQRLAGEIQGLQSRLSFARAEVQLKEATIQAQQFVIGQQNRLLSGEVMIGSLKDMTPKPKEEDKEELLSGMVMLTKVNLKGVEFNLPEIFRKLRRLFKEGEL